MINIFSQSTTSVCSPSFPLIFGMEWYGRTVRWFVEGVQEIPIRPLIICDLRLRLRRIETKRNSTKVPLFFNLAVFG